MGARAEEDSGSGSCDDDSQEIRRGASAAHVAREIAALSQRAVTVSIPPLSGEDLPLADEDRGTCSDGAGRIVGQDLEDTSDNKSEARHEVKAVDDESSIVTAVSDEKKSRVDQTIFAAIAPPLVDLRALHLDASISVPRDALLDRGGAAAARTARDDDLELGRNVLPPERGEHSIPPPRNVTPRRSRDSIPSRHTGGGESSIGAFAVPGICARNDSSSTGDDTTAAATRAAIGGGPPCRRPTLELDRNVMPPPYDASDSFSPHPDAERGPPVPPEGGAEEVSEVTVTDTADALLDDDLEVDRNVMPPERDEHSIPPPGQGRREREALSSLFSSAVLDGESTGGALPAVLVRDDVEPYGNNNVDDAFDDEHNDNGDAERPGRRRSVAENVLDMTRDAPLVEGAAVVPVASARGGAGRGGGAAAAWTVKGLLSRGRLPLVALAVAIVCAVGATVTIAMVARNKDGQGGVINGTGIEASDVKGGDELGQLSWWPTESPTPTPVSLRFVEMRDVLLRDFYAPSSSSSLAALQLHGGFTQQKATALFGDPASAQHRALAWLADEDERRLPVPTGADDNHELLNDMSRRYVFAVFRFALGVPVFWDWLSADNECQWNEIYCRCDLGDDVVPCPNSSVVVERIDIRGESLVGAIPQELFMHEKVITGLRHLVLDHNGISSMPDSICNLRTIKEISLSQNELEGTLPACLGELGDSLKFLYFRQNRLSGTIPSSWNQLSSLVNLELSMNQLSGNFDALDFEQLSSLNELNLYANLLSGSIPSSLRHFAGTQLFLAENPITGSIPDGIALGNMSRLELLLLSDMDLTGTIPPSIFEMRTLVAVLLGYNRMEGSIPHYIGSTPLPSLRALGLEKNNLSGVIPASVSKLSALQLLNVHSNLLSGHLPPALGNLSNLLVLEVGNNRLDGPVPESLRNLEKLDILSLKRNDFSGSINHLCDLLVSVPLLSVDCRGDVGAEVECSCCQSFQCCMDEESGACGDNYVESALMLKSCARGNGGDGGEGWC